MDFIENWLGLSPDAGSGATEVPWVVALAAVAAVAAGWALWRVRRRGP